MATHSKFKRGLCVAGNFSQSVDFDSGSGVDARTSLGETDIFVTKISHCGMLRAEGCP